MRCDEVLRELAAPTADRDPAAMAEHLAGCPACAEWSRRAETLDRLWESTRPVEPTPETWDAVWAGIAQTLPSPTLAESGPSRNGTGPRLLVHPEPSLLPSSSPASSPAPARRRLAAVALVGLVGLAQAAAVLVALGLAWRAAPGPGDARNAPGPVAGPVPPVVAVRSEKAVEAIVDVEAGCLMVIHLDRKSSRVEDRTPPEMNVSADIGMEMTNAMESIATPQMAAR